MFKVGDYVRYIGPFHWSYVKSGQDRLAGKIVWLDERKIEIEIDVSSAWGVEGQRTEANIEFWASTETDMGLEMKDAASYYQALTDGQLS